MVLLRRLVFALLLLYIASLYAEWTQDIAPEATRYQSDYPDAIRSGLALGFAISKLLWLVGSSVGVLGSVLIALGKSKKGVTPMLISAPLITIAAYLNAPQSNYPSVEPIVTILLWCATSAAWASVTILAWARNHAQAYSDDASGGPHEQNAADAQSASVDSESVKYEAQQRSARR